MVLERIERQKDEVFTILDRLESIYNHQGDKGSASKVIGEGDTINEQVSTETGVARKYLSVLVMNKAHKTSASSSSDASVSDESKKKQMAQRQGRLEQNTELDLDATTKQSELAAEDLESQSSDIEETVHTKALDLDLESVSLRESQKNMRRMVRMIGMR